MNELRHVLELQSLIEVIRFKYHRIGLSTVYARMLCVEGPEKLPVPVTNRVDSG